MIKPIAASAVFLLLVFPSVPQTAEVHLESRSYVLSREAGDSNDYLTLYEYLDTDLYGPGDYGFSFHAGGWGRADLLDESYGKDTNAELQYSYLSYKAENANLGAKLGRFYVTGGAARNEQLDGLSLGSGLTGGFDVSAYAGVPVETDDDGRSNDFLFGGRISQGIPGLYRLGLSFLKEENDKEDIREETGLDIFFRPSGFMELLGVSFYNSLEDGWMEHDYVIDLTLSENLGFTASANWLDYGKFFQSPRNPAFPGSEIDKEEEQTTLSAGVRYLLTQSLGLFLNYINYSYDIKGDADGYSAALDFTGGGVGAGLSFRRIDGESGRLSYYEYQGYAFKNYGNLEIAVDAFDVSYDEKINDVRNAYTLSFSCAWVPSAELRTEVDLEYGHNPDYDEEVRALLKIVYKFSKLFGEGGNGAHE